MTSSDAKTKMAFTIKQLLGSVAVLFLPSLLLLSSATFALSGFENAGANFMLRRKVDVDNDLKNSIEPLVFTPRIRSTPAVNLDYQYEDQDINALLRLRIQEEAAAGRLNLENIIILAPLSDSTGELENQLQEEQIRYRNNIIENGRSPYERTILVPVNLTRLSHWAGLVIKLNSDNNIQTINYVDSLNQNVPSTIIASLQNVYGPTISIQTTPGLLQTDTTSCGPLMIENLIRSATGMRISGVASSKKIKQIRTHHIILMEIARPDFNLKKRQQHNVRSFRDITGKILEANILHKNPQLHELCLQAGLNPVLCGGGKNEQPLWDQLPEELKLEILQHLPVASLALASSISKNWRRISNDNILWLHKAQAEFPQETILKALEIYENTIIGTKQLENDEPEKTTTKEKDFKHIYHTCHILSSQGSKLAMLKMYRKKRQLIEVGLITPNSSMQDIIKKITSADSIIRALVIEDTTISNTQALSIAEALKHPNCKITILDLSWNKLSEEGTLAIIEALKHPNCKITTLNLTGNHVGDSIAQSIAEILTHPTCKLSELELSNNHISKKGAIALGNSLKHENCKITLLDLNHNQIGDEGTVAIAEALKTKNCQLNTLKLVRNYLSSSGAYTLAKALKHGKCRIYTLDLIDNQLDIICAGAFANILKDPNCRLAQLALSGNNINDSVLKIIAEALKHENCKITALALDRNLIGPASIKALSDSLKDPKCKLTQLDLENNRVGDDNIESLAKTIAEINSAENYRTIEVFGLQYFDIFLEQAEKSLKQNK